MCTVLKIYDKLGLNLLVELIYNNNRISISCAGDKNYREALALELNHDFDRALYIHKSFIHLTAKKHTLDWLRALAIHEVHVYSNVIKWGRP